MELLKHKLPLVILTAVAVLNLSTAGSAQVQMSRTPDKTSNPAAAMFPLDELKPGMKGVAHTVFAGTELQEFGVEILGVLNGYTGPRQATIIARLSGPNIDKTGVFAGLSGSPVFIDHRLVGAVAYSFPFAKEPICGITPIKQMIDIFEPGNLKPRTNSEPRSVSFTEMAMGAWKAVMPKAVTAMPMVAAVSATSP